MPELQNLLRQKLAGTESGSQAHPDADTITAYVEQSLPTAERQTLVAHLAVCEPCREVLFLSQPEPELAAQAVIKPAPVSAWRRLFTPAFGLAATVAAMAIIAVLVLQLPHQAVRQQASIQHDQQATAQPTQAAQAPIPQAQLSPSQPSETQPSENGPAAARTAVAAPQTSRLDLAQSANKAKENLTRQASDKSADLKVVGGNIAPPPPPPAKAPALTAGLLKKDYVNTNFFADSGENVVLAGSNSNDAPSAPQPQSAATNRPFSYANSKITSFSDIPANAAGKSNVRIMTPTPASSERLNCPLCKVAQATAHTLHLRAVAPALRASTLGNSALGGPGMFSNTLEKGQSAEVSAAPKKTEGGSLANSDSFSSRALAESTFSYSADSPGTVWKVAGGKLIKSSGQSQWEDAYPAAAIEFSFVSARGQDVWAGGSRATLIHSHDSGATWETVKLGDSASGTVVSIIVGAFNLQVKTSDNQLWSSTDGGKNWTLSGE